MVTALRRFHEQFPDAALQINVTRHPYSFVGDTQVPGREMEGSWHKGLIAYSGGSEARALQAEQGLQMMGAQAGVKFDFSVPVNWQPVDSQRLLLWTGRHGKQEVCSAGTLAVYLCISQDPGPKIYWQDQPKREKQIWALEALKSVSDTHTGGTSL